MGKYSHYCAYEDDLCDEWKTRLKAHHDYAYAVHEVDGVQHLHIMFSNFSVLEDVALDFSISKVKTVNCRRALLDYLMADENCIEFVNRTLAGDLNGAR